MNNCSVPSDKTRVGKWLAKQGYRYYGRSGIHHEREEWGNRGVMVFHYRFNFPDGRGYESFEVSACFESVDRVWADLKFYSITEKELRKHLGTLSERLRGLRESMELPERKRA